MISKLLTILLVAPLAILLVIFCVVNRQPVTVSMDALGTTPQFAFEAPLFVLLIGALILGLLLGGFATWVGQARYRARASRRAREAENLRQEMEATQARMRRMREEQEQRERREAGSPGLSDRREAARPALAAPRAA